MPKVAILYKDLKGTGCKENQTILLKNEHHLPIVLYLQYNISSQICSVLLLNRSTSYYARSQ